MKIFSRFKRHKDTPYSPHGYSSRREGFKSFFSILAILIMAPLIALFLTAFVFQSYEVEGPSMQNTLQNQDRLIVFKVQRTWARITSHPYIPSRGDIIIFDQPKLLDYDNSDKKQLIKRVIGLPGERVAVKDGILTVYNKANPNGFQPDKTMPYGSAILTTPGEKEWNVPEGQIFVCGDNRVNSLDSRSFGPIPVSSVIGKLAVRVYPLNTAERF